MSDLNERHVLLRRGGERFGVITCQAPAHRSPWRFRRPAIIEIAVPEMVDKFRVACKHALYRTISMIAGIRASRPLTYS